MKSGFNKNFSSGEAGLSAGGNNTFKSGEKYSGSGGGNYYANSVPVAYWTFENVGDGKVHDVSSAGNNLDGTRLSDQYINDDPGTDPDNRPSFDTSTKILGASSMLFGHDRTDAVVVPDNNLLDFSTDTPFTLSVWIKRGDPDRGGIVGMLTKAAQASATDSAFEGYFLWFSDTQQRRPAFLLYKNVSGLQQLRVEAASLAFADNDFNWHNIVATYNGNSNLDGVKIYIDGSSVTTQLEPGHPDTLPPGADITTSTPLVMGGIVNNTAANPVQRLWPFSGNMDEVAIWSKELSAEEVAASYNSGAGVDLTNGIPDD